MDEQNRITSITCCADLLEQHSTIHILSVGFTLSTAITMLVLAVLGSLDIVSLVLLIIVIIAGIIEAIFSIRVGFDNRLLHQITKDNHSSEKELALLDDALIYLELISTDKTGRGLKERLKGCIVLLKWQALLCSFQAISIIAIASGFVFFE